MIGKDSGGRICLDTLKMPPKGSWVPSLNISTLLTTIRLLLAHPNPDDGLMADIVRCVGTLMYNFYSNRVFTLQTQEFKLNQSLYASKARAHTLQHAVRDSASVPAPSEEVLSHEVSSRTQGEALEQEQVLEWEKAPSKGKTEAGGTASGKVAEEEGDLSGCEGSGEEEWGDADEPDEQDEPDESDELDASDESSGSNEVEEQSAGQKPFKRPRII